MVMKIILKTNMIPSSWRTHMNKNLKHFAIVFILVCGLIGCNQDIVISTEPVLDLVNDSNNSVNQSSPASSNTNLSNSQNNPGASSSGAVGSAPGGATGTTTFGATGSPPRNPFN